MREKLFGKEAAPRAYRTILKFDAYEGNETPIVSIVLLESIMATVIDSFVEERIKRSAATSAQEKEKTKIARVCAIYQNTVAQPKVQRRRRGSCTLMDNIRKLKAYFPQFI